MTDFPEDHIKVRHVRSPLSFTYAQFACRSVRTAPRDPRDFGLNRSCICKALLNCRPDIPIENLQGIVVPLLRKFDKLYFLFNPVSTEGFKGSHFFCGIHVISIKL